MITIQDKLILKRRVHLQSGQQSIKTFKLIKCRQRGSSYQIYDIYDNQINEQLTLKMLIKTQQLSKEKSINEIKNQQLFTHLPHFISLLDIYEDSNCIYLIMEKWGLTLSEIVSVRNTLTEYEVQLIFSQLLDIIVELRKLNIAHNWIRLETIFIDLKDKHRIKLGEFGKSFNVGKYFESLTLEDSNRLSYQSEHHQRKHSKHNILTAFTQKSTSNESQPAISSYTSPQEVQLMQMKEPMEYSRYLSTLYENDLWSVGVIVYRLLMGRYPFQVEGDTINNQPFYDRNRNYHHLMPNNNNNHKHSKKEKSFVGKHKYSASTSDNTALLSTLIKQCCYNFHPNYYQQNHFQLTTFTSESVSPHFQELIKSLLKPISKRATVKLLLSHPLKLRYYDNVRGVDFGDYSAQLLSQSNVIICESLNSLRKQLRERLIQQERIKQQSKQQLLKYLTPVPDSPTFPLYNFDFHPFSLQSSAQYSNKYFTSWQVNFNPSYSQLEEFSFENANQQQQPAAQFVESSYKLNTQINDIHQHKIHAKLKKRTFHHPYENKIVQNDHYLNQDQKHSQASSQLLRQNNNSQKHQYPHQQVSSPSMYQSLNQNSALYRSLSTQNFNIRSLNPSKKTIEMGQKKQSQENKKLLLTSKKQNTQSGWYQKSDEQNDLSRKQTEKKYFGSRSSNNSQKSNEQNDNKSIRFYQQYNGYDEINENNHIQPSQSAKSSKQVSQKRKRTIRIQIGQDREKQMREFRDTLAAQQLIIKVQLQPIPLLVQQPEFILQYRFDKSTKSLGYVLNNGVGVIYSTGKHVMGHNQTDFVLLSKTNTYTHFLSSPQQLNQSSFHYNNFSKTNTQSKLTEEEISIYNNYIKLFGKRMVISNFSLSVVKYWQQGRIFIFLINNGSWQVTFEGKKTSKFFIIDQNQLIWSKTKNQKPSILNIVRNIVEKKKNSIICQKYYL